MTRNENQNQTSVMLKKACFDQPSPSSGCHGRNRARPGRHEEEKENRRGDPQPPLKPPAKHFMSPTISASMKMASPRNDQPVLVERNEAPDKKPLLAQDLEPSAHFFNFSTPTTPLPVKDSNFTVQDPEEGRPTPVLPPYDPFVNYLSPRPRFLRYNPNRQLERTRLESDTGEEEVGSEKKMLTEEETESSASQTGDSVYCQSDLSDDQTVPPTIAIIEIPPSSPIKSVSEDPIAVPREGEIPSEVVVDDEPVEETPLELVVDKPTPFLVVVDETVGTPSLAVADQSGQEIKWEESVLSEEEEIEEEEEEEEARSWWWRPSSVFESVLTLGLLIVVPFLVSYICSSSGVTFTDGGVGEEGLMMEIYDPLPHPSRFSFEKTTMNRMFSNGSIDTVGGESYLFDLPTLGAEQLESGVALFDEENSVVKPDLTLELEEEAVVENVEELSSMESPVEDMSVENVAELSSMESPVEDMLVENVEESPVEDMLVENVEELFSMESPVEDKVFNGDDDALSYSVEHPLSNKLSPSDMAALSLEPVCNTFGITSTYARIGNPPPKTRDYAFLFSLKTTLISAAILFSSIIFLKFLIGPISSLVSATQRIGDTSTSTRKSSSPRRSSMSSTNQDSSRMSMSTLDSASYGSITVQKEVKLKQEVVSTPVRRSSRLLNRITSS